MRAFRLCWFNIKNSPWEGFLVYFTKKFCEKRGLPKLLPYWALGFSKFFTLQFESCIITALIQICYVNQSTRLLCIGPMFMFIFKHILHYYTVWSMIMIRVDRRRRCDRLPCSAADDWQCFTALIFLNFCVLIFAKGNVPMPDHQKVGLWRASIGMRRRRRGCWCWWHYYKRPVTGTGGLIKIFCSKIMTKFQENSALRNLFFKIKFFCPKIYGKKSKFP